MRAPRLLLATLIATLATLAAPALAATPQVTLPDIEDEVMCTQCGTPLNISEAPVADRERAFIRRLIEQGRSKEEIKAALEVEYGPRVLAVPSRGGFDDAAYVVPIVLGALGLLGVAYAARRWRRQRGPDDAGDLHPGDDRADELDPDDARRLDAELAAFDAR